MKALLIVLLFSISNLAKAQKIDKKVIDYQYFRDESNYYAFEIFKDSSINKPNEVKLTFTWKGATDLIEKLTLKTDQKDWTISFNARKDLIKTDNKELNTIGLIFNYANVLKAEGCEAKLVFKLKSGSIYALPFNVCTFKSNVVNP